MIIGGACEKQAPLFLNPTTCTYAGWMVEWWVYVNGKCEKDKKH
jgi:hypothetical protein